MPQERIRAGEPSGRAALVFARRAASRNGGRFRHYSVAAMTFRLAVNTQKAMSNKIHVHLDGDVGSLEKGGGSHYELVFDLISFEAQILWHAWVFWGGSFEELRDVDNPFWEKHSGIVNKAMCEVERLKREESDNVGQDPQVE